MRAPGRFLCLGATLLLAGLGWHPAARGQTAAATPAPTGLTTSRPDALWRCELPGGVYLVALRSIASISSHEYVVDGAARVTEVTVATNSSVEARFYYLEPISPTDVAPSAPGASTLQTLQQHVHDLTAGQAQAGSDDTVWQKVVKIIPPPRTRTRWNTGWFPSKICSSSTRAWSNPGPPAKGST